MIIGLADLNETVLFWEWMYICTVSTHEIMTNNVLAVIWTHPTEVRSP
jgi:hypothetical protein